MNQSIELKQLSQEEILMAAETLNTTTPGKRRIILTPVGLATIADQLRSLPNSPGLPAGEIIPGVSGYLYNIPVFVDPDSKTNCML